MTKFLYALMAAMLLVGGATVVSAQTDDAEASDTATAESSTQSKVTFPIAELGNCDSKEACKLYCDEATNREACFSYAQKVGLMNKEKVAAAKMLLKKEGPGGCDSRESCTLYCQDSSHHDECLSFAQKHKVLSVEKASLIKKFTSGEGPGACKSAATCRMYCEDPAHKDECRAFAEENGLVRKIGSSTVERVKGILASTTPGRERGMELRKLNGSSTAPGILKNEMQRKFSSTSPSNIRKPFPPKPKVGTSTNDGLGAAVLRGFIRLLGF